VRKCVSSANADGEPNATLEHTSVTEQDVGAGQAHSNMPPFLAINFCIALVGLFPPRD